MTQNMHISNVNYNLLILLNTLIGLILSIIYVKNSYSNFILFLIGFILLCAPMIFCIISKNERSLNVQFLLLILLITVFFNQYISVLNSSHFQGTDAPFNFNLVNILLNNDGKFNLYQETASFNQNFYGLPLFCNVVSIFLNIPLNVISLFIPPFFGVISIFIYFFLIKNLFPVKLALISSIFLGWSLTYVGYGLELRPENLGFLYFTIIFFVTIKRNILMPPNLSSSHNPSYPILAIIVSLILVVTHSAATIHSILIFILFQFSVLCYAKRNKSKVFNEHISLIICILFIFYLMYLTSSYWTFFNMVLQGIKNAFLIDQNVILEEKGVSALSSEIPILITIIIWVERMLFLMGISILGYNFYRKKAEYYTLPYFFVFIWSLAYISIILLSISAQTLNPSRFYRFFEIPLSIIISIPLLYFITFSPYQLYDKPILFQNSSFWDKFMKLIFSYKIREVFVPIVILLIMINSVFLLPNWIIHVGINDYHERPYADFSDQDIFAGEFASKNINNFSFAGDFRTHVIFGLIGKKNVIILNSINNSGYLDLNGPIFIGLDENNYKNGCFNEGFAEGCYKIYSNQQLSINLIP